MKKLTGITEGFTAEELLLNPVDRSPALVGRAP